MTTQDGYELKEGDAFWMYVQEVDGYIEHVALALADGWIYYDKTEGRLEADIFGRVRESDVWSSKQVSYRQLRELAASMDEQITDLCECCCDDCPEELDTSISWMVDRAYELGRRSA